LPVCDGVQHDLFFFWSYGKRTVEYCHSGTRSNYLVGLVFFLIPFLLAQFMSNRGAMLIFYPIAIAACHKLSGDPRGLILLIESGTLAAFMTPMPTAAVPYMMSYGGYTQKDLLRGGWLFAVLCCLISVFWIMTIMPVIINPSVQASAAGIPIWETSATPVLSDW